MDAERARPRGLKGSWEWLAFAAQLPANPIPLTSLSASTLIYSGRCILMGASVQNNGAGAGGINLLDGLDATGAAVVIQPLAAQAAAVIDLPGNGVLCELGVFAQITTATIRGSVWVVPLWHYPNTGPGS